MTSLLIEEARTYAKILAKNLLPKSSTTWLRTSAQQRRRAERRNAGGETATRQKLADDLRALGVERGRDLLVHSAMSALGPIDGGAATLFAALAEVAGPEATILAPAYPMLGSMHDWMASDETFDLKRTKSRMGSFTEHMRSLPGGRRSAHPTHSIVAIGPRAEDYVADHHRGPTATGPLSPFGKHIARRGQILCLGTGVGKITSYHVVEDVMSDFPISPYLTPTMKKTVLFEDGERREIETRIHDPRLSPWRVDNFEPKEHEIHALLRACELINEGRVGAAPSCVIDAAGLLAAMQDWAMHGTTIYHQPKLKPLGLLLGL